MTANDIIEMALRRIGIVSRDEAMLADDAAHALTAMNLMMHGWASRGADVYHSDLALTSTVQLPDDLLDGLVYLLAVRLAPDFSARTPTADGFDYDQWWRAVQNAYLPDGAMTFDRALRRLPSQRDTDAEG